MIYEPCSVIVVPFPFVDSPKAKPRPVMVLSSKDYQKNTGHVTVVMITTAKSIAWYTDYPIENLNACGLKLPSVIRQKIFTLDKRVIKKKIGSLAQNDKKNIAKLIKKHLLI